MPHGHDDMMMPRHTSRPPVRKQPSIPHQGGDSVASLRERYFVEAARFDAEISLIHRRRKPCLPRFRMPRVSLSLLRCCSKRRIAFQQHRHCLVRHAGLFTSFCVISYGATRRLMRQEEPIFSILTFSRRGRLQRRGSVVKLALDAVDADYHKKPARLGRHFSSSTFHECTRQLDAIVTAASAGFFSKAFCSAFCAVQGDKYAPRRLPRAAAHAAADGCRRKQQMP